MSLDSDPRRLPSLQTADAMQLLVHMIFTGKHKIKVTNVRWNISHNHSIDTIDLRVYNIYDHSIHVDNT